LWRERERERESKKIIFGTFCRLKKGVICKKFTHFSLLAKEFKKRSQAAIEIFLPLN
jgi:hypothetical protein